MKTKVYFDMDGTIADLYNVEDWLPKIIKEEKGAYLSAKPLFNQKDLEEILTKLFHKGVEFGVISWGAKNSSTDYLKQTEKEKRTWLKMYIPTLESDVTVQPYGTPKHMAITGKYDNIYLVDDNAEVLTEWEENSNRKGVKVSNTYDVVMALYGILEELEG
jgi:phosphoglycolate phosphatase-like HAD superfamily hydrolase